VPKDWDGNYTPNLFPIDPTQAGWLMDKWRRDQAPTAESAPVGHYKGDPKQAVLNGGEVGIGLVCFLNLRIPEPQELQANQAIAFVPQ